MDTRCRSTLGRSPGREQLPAGGRCAHPGRRDLRRTPARTCRHIGRHQKVLRHARHPAGGVRD
eukprot:2586175-Pyramimonas_sp.AAC.1